MRLFLERDAQFELHNKEAALGKRSYFVNHNELSDSVILKKNIFFSLKQIYQKITEFIFVKFSDEGVSGILPMTSDKRSTIYDWNFGLNQLEYKYNPSQTVPDTLGL